MKMNANTRKRALSGLCAMSPAVIMVVVLVFFSIASTTQDVAFLTASNLSVIVNQASFLMVVGVGQALVILTGGVNLSMGSVMAFSTVLWGGMLLKDSGVPVFVPVLLVLATAALVGVVNGLLITKLRIPPFIATFATMYTCRGLAWVYLRNRVLYPLNEGFRVIAMGRLFSIGSFTVTMPMVIAAATLVLSFLLLRRTNYGARIYFTGANPVAARFSGINTHRTIISAHVLSSVLAGLAGLMYVARLNACEPGMAGSTHFEAITVSLIGGLSMAGGYGNILGVAGGAVVVYSIQSGMNNLQLPSEYQMLVNGALIIFAVFLNQRLANKRMQLVNELSETDPKPEQAAPQPQ